MCRAQDFQLKSRHSSSLYKFIKLGFSNLHSVIIKIILNFLRVENIESILLVIRNCSYISSILHGRNIALSTWSFHVWVVVCWAPIAWSILILRVSSIRLIGVLPLVLILILKHSSNIFFHGHGELSIGIHWSIVAGIKFGILIIYVHASTTWEISVTKNHSLKN
jgi:hypothetical protein